MRPLAITNYSDYRRKVELKGIEEHRKYINGQMAQARDTADAAQRSQCLANALAANGLMLRGMDVGFVTGELNYQAIHEISTGIQSTRSFQSLMEDSGEQLAQNGSVDTLVHDLKERDRALSGEKQTSRPAIDVIRGVQVKARTRTAQPRDYAELVAAHRLSSWRKRERAPDGKIVEVTQRDLNRSLDGKQLGEETERVMQDPDFRYVMGHEKPEKLYLNALRINGVALEQYPKRAEKLRSLEAKQEKKAGREELAAPQKPEQAPAL